MREPVLRQLIPVEEFDYPTLMGVLAGYAHPRDKISQLLRNGTLVRVKKGLYIFGKAYRLRPYSPEILANLIYGPSFISLDYALQYYGLIPEGVETITSVTLGRSRKFETPVGHFSYHMIPVAAIRSGMARVEASDGRFFLIAHPEKALADKLWSDRGVEIRSLRDIETYLLEDLRLEMSWLSKFDADRFTDYAQRYSSRKITFLDKFVRDRHRSTMDYAHA